MNNNNSLDPKIIFEHPLNEKMRTWLRIEFLIKQINDNKPFNRHNMLLFFHLLSELLEIVERNDIRSDLIKELEEQKQKLAIWLNVSGVDTQLLNVLLDKLNTVLTQLNSNNCLGQALKEDRLLNAVRKRLTIPGGCCSFDLPSFYLWLHQSDEYKTQQLGAWLNEFSTLSIAISLYLQLLRQSCEFKLHICSGNFYQDNNEAIKMIRIRVPVEKQLFPQISGNANRYTIRFLPLHKESETLNQQTKNSIEFELASC